MRIRQTIWGPLSGWCVVSLLLHLAVIGTLILVVRLPRKAPEAVHVILVSLPGSGAGSSFAGGGGEGERRSVTARPQAGVRGKNLLPRPGSTGKKIDQGPDQERRGRLRALGKPVLSATKGGGVTAGAPSPSVHPRKLSSSVRQEAVMPSGPPPDDEPQESSGRPGGEQADRMDSGASDSEGQRERRGWPIDASTGGASSGNSLDRVGEPGGGRGGGDGSGLGTGAGPGTGPGTSAGTGVGQGRGGDWRRVLLQRIERAKRYPPQARLWGMEGTAEVQFRIAGDGSIKDVTVVQSSGFALLDRASVETIKRAAPLPAVRGTIRVPISYRLRDAQ